jgi:hypothetical protein
MKNKILTDNDPFLSIHDNQILNVLKSSGKSRSIHDLPILESYLTLYGNYPMIKDFSEICLNHNSLIEDLKKIGYEILLSKEIIDEKTFQSEMSSILIKIGNGYMLQIDTNYESIGNLEVNLHEELQKISGKDNTVIIANVILLSPNSDSSLYSEDTEDCISSIIKKNRINRNETTPCISMICVNDGSYYLKDFFINKDYTIKYPDLHYGKGFSQFHKSLIERYKNNSKGLTLFHGQPGTGKTYYIRSLIKELLTIGKSIIYLPPNMVESMIYPEMMTFLSSSVTSLAEEGKSCVLLIEDAEPLLTSRNHESRTAGITNLLNVTDGLLNDMLSIQVIATFNTDLENIDSALLRPERLTARKEFKKLNKEDSQILSEKLNIDIKIHDDMSLAEIYSQLNDTEILIHEYDDNKNRKIGF